jgi:hypothetical protein
VLPVNQVNLLKRVNRRKRMKQMHHHLLPVHLQ